MLVDVSITEQCVYWLQIESLQADSDFSKEQLTNMRARMDSMKETSVDSLRIPEHISQGRLGLCLMLPLPVDIFTNAQFVINYKNYCAFIISAV